MQNIEKRFFSCAHIGRSSRKFSAIVKKISCKYSLLERIQYIIWDIQNNNREIKFSLKWIESTETKLQKNPFFWPSSGADYVFRLRKKKTSEARSACDRLPHCCNHRRTVIDFLQSDALGTLFGSRLQLLQSAVLNLNDFFHIGWSEENLISDMKFSRFSYSQY